MAEIATALPPPQVAHLAEAALCCFKDEMLHLLTKKRVDFQLHQSNAPQGTSNSTCLTTKSDEKEDTMEKIRLGLSRAILEPDMLPPSEPWEPMGAPATNFIGARSVFPPSASEFQYGHSGLGNEGNGSPWNPNMCTGSTHTPGDQQGRLDGIIEEEDGEESNGERFGRRIQHIQLRLCFMGFTSR
ncbi:hypothetical protein ACJRO7_025483 [Eucalyptus globulus]|uniref:Uncharacterized protein n=1 Tax=Eucalyptus globulus TaxID=34317 RepID=A0ABD3K9F3_EUCGL